MTRQLLFTWVVQQRAPVILSEYTMEIPLLKDILILFGLAIVVLLICHRLHVPTVVGFLLTGILAGPHGLRMISAVHEVEILAEIGIVLLLFTIGIEFSMGKLTN